MLKTEQARTDDASSRSTSRFLDKLRSFHGKTLVISCYKGSHLYKLEEVQSRIKLPGYGSIFNLLGRIADKHIALQEVRMVMGPTGNLTGVRFRKYAGMGDKLVYLKDIDENSAFYAYEIPYSPWSGFSLARIAILKLVNRGIVIVKIDENEWIHPPRDCNFYKSLPFNSGIVTGLGTDITKKMLQFSESRLLSRMNRLDPNVDPDWILLLKANYYAASFNDKDMPAFYSNF